MDDQAAIERYQAGNVDAFRQVVEQYQAEAMGHALALLASREDAEDAVQEAFVKAFRALRRFQAGRRFYPWFYTILRHCCFRIGARRPAVVVASDPPLEMLGVPARRGGTAMPKPAGGCAVAPGADH